jgi:hypothetical protein
MLQSTTQGTTKIFEQLAANLSELSGHHNSHSNGQGCCRDAHTGSNQRYQENRRSITHLIVRSGCMKNPSICRRHELIEARFGVFVQNAVTMGSGYVPTWPPLTDPPNFNNERTLTLKKMDPITEEEHLYPDQDRHCTTRVTEYLLKTHRLRALVLNYPSLTK